MQLFCVKTIVKESYSFELAYLKKKKKKKKMMMMMMMMMMMIMIMILAIWKLSGLVLS